MMENKLLSTIYNKYGKTPFTTTICYPLMGLDENEHKIIELVHSIQLYLNKKYNIDLNIELVSILFIYMYNSNKVIYDLPYMLDNIQKGGKPCLHIVYSDTVAQLVSISLMSESILVLKDLYSAVGLHDIERQSILYSILLDDSDYRHPDIFTKDSKTELLELYNKMVSSLFKICIKISVQCYYNYIDNVKEIYSQLNELFL